MNSSRLAVAAMAATLVGATNPEPYPHANEPIGRVREIYDGVLAPDIAVNTFRNIDRLFPTRTIRRSLTPRALPAAEVPLKSFKFRFKDKDYTLEDYLDLNRVAGLLVLKDGRVALETYRYGNTAQTRWMSMSIAKSVTSTLIGAAVKDGFIRLDDPVNLYVPSLAKTAYDGVTVREVLTMASGVRWNEAYSDPASDRRRLLEAQIAQAPGLALGVMRTLPRAAAPGTVHVYSTGETQVAGQVLRNAVRRPLAKYLEETIWRPAGMEADANWWLDSADGVEIGGSGISATLRDYARFGQFLLEDGRIGARAVLPDGWVAEATSPKLLKGGAPIAYGYLWWTPPTDAGKADRAYSAIGLYGQRLYVNPAARVVIAQWGARATPLGGETINDWAFEDAVVAAMR